MAPVSFLIFWYISCDVLLSLFCFDVDKSTLTHMCISSAPEAATPKLPKCLKKWTMLLLHQFCCLLGDFRDIFRALSCELKILDCSHFLAVSVLNNVLHSFLFLKSFILYYEFCLILSDYVAIAVIWNKPAKTSLWRPRPGKWWGDGVGTKKMGGGAEEPSWHVFVLIYIS